MNYILTLSSLCICIGLLLLFYKKNNLSSTNQQLSIQVQPYKSLGKILLIFGIILYCIHYFTTDENIQKLNPKSKYIQYYFF